MSVYLMRAGLPRARRRFNFKKFNNYARCRKIFSDTRGKIGE
jgi:hypothetical protein